MLTPTVAAHAAQPRPQRAHITTQIDRSNCRASRHGTASAVHNHRCICPDGLDHNYRTRKRNRLGQSTAVFTSSVGTIRRIHALQAVGWSYSALGRELGTVGREVWRWTTMDRIRVATRDRVLALYVRLLEQPAPTGTAADRTRREARARGRARPEHWDGVDMDDPAAVSDLTYARDDQHAANGDDAAWLASPDGGGLDDEQIAERLGVTVEQVKDWQRGLGIAIGRTGMSDDQIYEIRDRWVAETAAGRLDRDQLARDYGLSKCGLLDIIVGRARPHLRLPDLLGDSPYRHGRQGRRSAA